MVRRGALVEALVSQEVAPVVALFALKANLVALKAPLVTLRADAVDLEVAARAVVPARAIKVEGKFAPGSRVALQALVGLVNRTLPARPVAI